MMATATVKISVSLATSLPLSFLFMVLVSSQSLFDPSVRPRRQMRTPPSFLFAPARPSSPRGAHRRTPKHRPFLGSNSFYCIMSKRLCHPKRRVSSENGAKSLHVRCNAPAFSAVRRFFPDNSPQILVFLPNIRI